MATDAAGVIASLSAKYEKALAEGDLLFFPSTIHEHEENGVKFAVRLCPALQHKPRLPTPHFDASKKTTQGKPDPFMPPYVPNLYIGELHDEEEEGAQYVVLLNKYCVVPMHFLLASKEYISQASPLLPADLVQSYRLLLAARRAGKYLLAFYNCGDRSGASQPHKHLQFLPMEDFDGPPVERLAKSINVENPTRPFTLTALPYANHVCRLPSMNDSTPRDEMESSLAQVFLQLLDLVISTVRHDPDHPSGTPSYNVLLTLEHMHLIPRRQETYVLPETGEEVSINSLGFAGMPLVKSDRELEAVKREGVGKILRGVGLESVHEIQVDGTSREAPDGQA